MGFPGGRGLPREVRESLIRLGILRRSVEKLWSGGTCGRNGADGEKEGCLKEDPRAGAMRVSSGKESRRKLPANVKREGVRNESYYRLERGKEG